MGGPRRGRSAGLPIDDAVASAPSPAAPPPPAAPPDSSSTASLSTTSPPGASVSTTTESWSEVTAGSPHSRRANDNITTIATGDNNITDITPPTTTTDPSSTTTHGAVNFSLHPDFDLSDDAGGGGHPPTLATMIYPLPLLGGMSILTPSAPLLLRNYLRNLIFSVPKPTISKLNSTVNVRKPPISKLNLTTNVRFMSVSIGRLLTFSMNSKPSMTPLHHIRI
jgi:hypothetical protein